MALYMTGPQHSHSCGSRMATPLMTMMIACMYKVLNFETAVAVLDNLVKGAAGQALQNLNIMMGQPEGTALMQQAMFP